MVIITKGLPDKLKISATELFLEALSEKFIPILGRKGKAKELIELSIEPGNCFYADQPGSGHGPTATGFKSLLDCLSVAEGS